MAATKTKSRTRHDYFDPEGLFGCDSYIYLYICMVYTLETR